MDLSNDSVHSWINKHQGANVDGQIPYKRNEDLGGRVFIHRFCSIDEMYLHGDDGYPDMLRIAFDRGGNHLCVNIIDSSVHFWDHEGNIFFKVCDDIWDMLDLISPLKESSFDEIARKGKLSDIENFFPNSNRNELKSHRLPFKSDWLLFETAVIFGNRALAIEMLDAGYELGNGLMCAVKNNRVDLVVDLLEYGVDPFGVDLRLAELLGYSDIVKVLKKAQEGM